MLASTICKLGIRKCLKEIQIQNCFLKKIFNKSKRKCEKRKVISPLDFLVSQEEHNRLYLVLPFPPFDTPSLSSIRSLPLALPLLPRWSETPKAQLTLKAHSEQEKPLTLGFKPRSHSGLKAIVK